MNTCHYTFTQTQKMCKARLNCKVNCGLWVIMMCLYTFILGKKKNCTIVVKDNRGGNTCVKIGDIWEISWLSFQFCCKLKTSLQKQSAKIQ